MYEIYCKLRDERGMKDSDVVKGTGITKSTFSDWKNGRSNPKNEKLQKIADFFGVTLDYLMTGTTGNDLCSSCPDCGMWYDANDPEDVRSHQKNHAEWKKAAEKFAKLYCNSAENERIKAENRNISHNTTLPLNERVNAQIEVLRCLFSRSVEGSGYDLRHVPFEEYVSMMLGNESYSKNNLENDLYQKLVEDFGTAPGISNGSIYHIPQPQTIAAHFEGEEFTEEELADIKAYAEFVKSRRK